MGEALPLFLGANVADIPSSGTPAEQSYANGRILARYRGNVPSLTPLSKGTPEWWTNEGIVDVWNGIPPRNGVEVYFSGPDGGNLPAQYGPGTDRPTYPQQPTNQQGAPVVRIAPPVQSGNPVVRVAPPVYRPPVVRPAPPYIPKPNVGPGTYVPPPGIILVERTYELFAMQGGRKTPLENVLNFDGRHYSLRGNSRVLVAGNSRDGFGYAGAPGSWDQLYPGKSPADFGQDPRFGIVAFDGRQARAFAGSRLAELFGSDWRNTVYAAN